LNKIDQTFAAKLESNASSAAIIRTIIEYFTWLNAKLDSIETVPSSRVWPWWQGGWP
jgi:EAL domain-containing protein (putative c-di-GMP-specific phosphodiesterase class I)